MRVATAALAGYLRAAPGAVAARSALTLAAGTAPVAAAWATKAMLDSLVGRRVTGAVWSAAALAVISGVAALCPHLVRYADREIGRRVAADAQRRLFTAATARTGIAELEDPRFQDRLRLAVQAAQSGPQQLASAAFAIAQGVVSVAGFLTALLAIAPVAAGLVAASAVPAFWTQRRLGVRRGEAMVRSAPKLRRQIFYATLLIDPRAGKEIRLFGLGTFFRDRMLAELHAAQDSDRGIDRATLRVDCGFAALAAVVSGAALVWTAARIATGHGSVGDISVLAAALGSVQAGVAGIVAQTAMASQALILFGHYADLVAENPEPRAALPTAEPLREGIRFHGVWFRYHEDTSWVLRDFDLTIPRGASVALVGLNGAGKTTVVKLLCRLYEPTKGVITWDGVDVATLDPVELRRRIGTVFQDFMSYDLTAAENVGTGDLSALEDPDLRRIRAAAGEAGVEESLAALPDGYHTMLSRTFAPSAGAALGIGVTLSGGQWQRVAVARAMLRRDVDLLILDEPTSGLDPRAEDDLLAALRRLRTGRGGASLLISHRLNTVREADLIVVLDAGRVAEQGTHDTLLAADSGYAHLFRRQAAGFAAAPIETGS